jgi:mRNA-degrading endonuclease RelE of RelBE toxin-antitoxin system
VTYTIVIQPGARVTYQRLRQADRTQVRAVKKAIDALAADPRPAGVHRYGGADVYRLDTPPGLSILYEVDDETRSVRINLISLHTT